MSRAILFPLASVLVLLVAPSAARARSPYWQRNCDLDPQLAKAQVVERSVCRTSGDAPHPAPPPYAITIEVESVTGALERISGLTDSAGGTIDRIERDDFRGDATLVELRIPDQRFGYARSFPACTTSVTSSRRTRTPVTASIVGSST